SGECGAGSEADCRQSDLCAVSGNCLPSAQNRCRVGTAEDCAAAERCTTRGECSPDEYGCAPRTPDHCANSELCATSGLCVIGARYCEANTAGCQASELCTKHSYCPADECSCHTAGSTDAACREHAACAGIGWCTSADGACIGGTGADCEMTTGWLQNNSCQKVGQTCGIRK